MELHHSAETEAPKKVTKLFLNRPLVRISETGYAFPLRHSNAPRRDDDADSSAPLFLLRPVSGADTSSIPCVSWLGGGSKYRPVLQRLQAGLRALRFQPR